MVDCGTCKTRNSCTKLCEEAERFVNQDHVYQRELAIGIPMYIENNDFFMRKSTEEIIIHLYFVKRLKQGEIADIVNLNQSSVSRIIAKYRKIITDNLKK